MYEVRTTMYEYKRRISMFRRTLLFLITSLFIFTSITTARAFHGSQGSSGALTAQADTQSGSANFGVPIDVPPGRAGIQPNIQLQYSSSLPNGLLGVGWSLELGSIQRSAKKGAPSYTDSDTFVLVQSGSGQELVFDAVTGLYRGKVEGSFMKIEQTAGSWKVTDKSGVQYFFGETASAREYDPANTARVFKWYLERVEDLHGNYMTLDYFRDENKLYPQTIRYTGNAQLGLLPFAQVAFEREARPENGAKYYNAGYRMSIRYRISRITVTVEGNLPRRYDLVYGNSRVTGRSLLSLVTQSGSDGLSSLQPLTFTYQDDADPTYTLVSYFNNGTTQDDRMLLGDFNGDGMTDLANFNRATGQTKVSEANGASFDSPEVWILNFGAGSEIFTGDLTAM